jgi:hypothetical protein
MTDFAREAELVRQSLGQKRDVRVTRTTSNRIRGNQIHDETSASEDSPSLELGEIGSEMGGFPLTPPRLVRQSSSTTPAVKGMGGGVILSPFTSSNPSPTVQLRAKGWEAKTPSEADTGGVGSLRLGKPSCARLGKPAADATGYKGYGSMFRGGLKEASQVG